MGRVADESLNRKQTPGELFGQTRSALARLDAAISRYDDGDDAALGDISSLLRLLVTTGQGNDLLRRAGDLLNGDLPEFANLGPEVGDGDDSTEFDLGAQPAIDPTDRGAAPATIAEAMSRRVLVVRSGGALVRYTWSDLIRLAANKLGGTHSDEKLPLAADQVLAYTTLGGLGFLPTSLRQMAVAVSRYGHRLVSLISAEPIASPEHPNTSPRAGGWVGAASVHMSDRGRADFERGELPSIPKVGRNEPCPCGSGAKYKFCHGR